MRRFLRLIGITAAAVLAAAVVYAVATLPPRALQTSEPAADARLAWGAYHVHSTRSDGSGTIDEIAAAAARAGLHFVIFTDHGDGTRIDAPVYRHGVLCIDAPELNTLGGHLVALNLQHASPYPLAGEASDVIEDVHRLGGWAVAAHPESPRPELRWRGSAVRIDGYEWLNVDSEWRAHGRWRLLGAGLRAFIRGPETIASLFESTRWLDRPNRLAGGSRMFSLAALDAHARVGSDSNGSAGGGSLSFPSYSTLFRTVAQAVPLEQPLTGDAGVDSRLILDAIHDRKSYAIVRGFADVLAPLHIETSDDVVTGSTPALPEASIRSTAIAPGRFRLEGRLEGRSFPWLVSDVIDLRQEPSPTAVVAEDATPATHPVVPTIPVSEWRIEKEPTSSAAIETPDDRLVLTYRLGPGAAAGQYVALSAPAGAEPVERIEFTASARAPMRISLQVRVPGGHDGQRWGKSIYLDETARSISVRLAEMNPIDRQTALRPVVARVQSVLVVVDTLNTKPGSAGEITFRDVRFVRGNASGESAPRTP